MKCKVFIDKEESHAGKELCKWVNRNKIKVISIGSGWNRWEWEFCLFYEEAKKTK